MGLGGSPSWGLWLLTREAHGARGGPEQEEVSADPLCACQVLRGKNPHRPAFGARSVGYYSIHCAGVVLTQR